MLNEHLTWLGLSEEWRPPLYKKRPRPRFDHEMFVETDSVLTKTLVDVHSPNLEIWRMMLRLYRETRDFKAKHKKAQQDHQSGKRKTRPSMTRPRYAFEIEGRRYQSNLTEDLDFEIIRWLGDGVTMINNKVRLGKMELPNTMIESLIGRPLGSIVEMAGIDQSDYGDIIVEKAYGQGSSTYLILPKFEGQHRLLNFSAIEPLLEKQDKKARETAA